MDCSLLVAVVFGSVGSVIDDHPREVIALGVALLVLAVGLLPLLLRRKSDLNVSAVDHELFAEGYSKRDGIGTFSGFAHAMAAAEAKPGEEPKEVMYLVSDPRKPAPFWVRLDEVSALTTPRRRVIGYASMSPAERAGGSDSLAVQRGAIRDECRRRGWQLLEVVADAPPEGAALERTGLARALELIAAGDAEALVASSLERLGDSAAEVAQLVERFDVEQASLVVLDPNVDMATEAGRLVARAIGSVSALERSGAAPEGQPAAAWGPAPEEPYRNGAVGAEKQPRAVEKEPVEPASSEVPAGESDAREEAPGEEATAPGAHPQEPVAEEVTEPPREEPPPQELARYPSPASAPRNGAPPIPPRRSGNTAVRGTRTLLSRWLQSR